SDFAKITCSAFLLELVEQTTGFGNKENPVFDLLAGALFSMEKTDRPLGLAVFFIIHLLRLHGIFDLTLRCKVCGANDFSAFAFDTHDMGVVCGNCSGADKDMLGKDALDFVSASLNTKFSGIAQHKYSAASLRGLLFSMSLFLERYFSMKIRSKELILNITGHIH
ncbi:MAG: DNA repair protein RecO, partial [Spirochaetia bacterium]|nr:DNA repair protein RecO [Spirochaetia bacterium]